MTGPLVVAHWISSQYLFSTIDPVTFGAGSKPLHNVVARAGVYEGGAGDLRIGLPLESVSCAGRREHQPLRLLAIIEARRERIDAVVARNPLLRNLVGNGWISMVARSGPGDPFMMRDRAGAWRPWYRDAADPSATNDQQIGAPHEPVP